MAKLTQIIKNDFGEVGRVLKDVAKGTIRGVVQGIYTPALINTGARQFVNEVSREDKSNVEIISKDVTQVASAALIYIPLTVHAIEQNKGLEYFGVLTATNVIDYLINAYKRSKK